MQKHEEEEVLKERRDLLKLHNDTMENKGIHRYQLEKDHDLPTVEHIMPQQECKWDAFKNDKMAKRRLLIDILRKNFTKVFMQIKMKNRLKCIKELVGCEGLEDLKKKSKQEV